MSLFRRNKPNSGDNDTDSAPGPVAVGEHDLRRVDALLTGFERAVGTDEHAIRAAILAIARAGGSGTAEDFFRDPTFLRRRNTMERITRPWLWLAAVVGEAARRGDPALVGRVCLFMFTWCAMAKPGLTIGDIAEVGLAHPDRSRRFAIAAVGLNCLASVDLTQVANPFSNEHVTVKQILLGCAVEVLDAASDGHPVDSGIQAEAQKVINQHG